MPRLSWRRRRQDYVHHVRSPTGRRRTSAPRGTARPAPTVTASVGRADPDGSPHHDAAAGPSPRARPATTARRRQAAALRTRRPHTDCATCHDGMNQPTGRLRGLPRGQPGFRWAADRLLELAGLRRRRLSRQDREPRRDADQRPRRAPPATPRTTRSLGTCTKCHTGPAELPSRYGHGDTPGDCATCHNGTIAAAAAEPRAATAPSCTTCHTGMDRPSGDCLACHDKAQGGVPAVVYTNDLSCGDARCHAKILNHSGTPISGVACTTCHVAHYEALGTCATCHADPTKFHHGTAVGDAAGRLHAAATTARSRRPSRRTPGRRAPPATTDMARPPVPATCHNCHDAQTFGAVACTTCHSTTRRDRQGDGPRHGPGLHGELHHLPRRSTTRISAPATRVTAVMPRRITARPRWPTRS